MHRNYVIGSAPSFPLLHEISRPTGAFHRVLFHKGILSNSVLCRGILSNSRYFIAISREGIFEELIYSNSAAGSEKRRTY